MKIRLGDIIIALAVAAVAVVLLVTAASGVSHGLTAVVLVDGVETHRVNLDRIDGHQDIVLEDLDVVIEVEHGRIAFKSSSCLDKTCVNTGWLDNPGDVAVCLPNRVVVKVIRKQNSEVDVIAE